MSEPVLPPPSPSTTPPAPMAEEMTPQEIEQGKVLAALGYPIGIIAIVMFFVRNNRFALFHAKQMVALIIVQLAAIIPFLLLSCIITGVAGAAGGAAGSGGNAAASAGGGVAMALGCVLYIVWALVCLASLVLIIMGLINAIQGKAKPLPFVGGLAAKWFKNVHVKA